MTAKTPSTILEILGLSVNDHVEKKGKLSYLSWNWAWDTALRIDPQVTFEVQMFDGKCYMDINGTAMVWVTVTLLGKPMTCQLPVMNNKNDPITFAGRTNYDRNKVDQFEVIDSYNVNTAIMRCMTKALALHGLGLYIYSGEDLPVIDPPFLTASDQEKLTSLRRWGADLNVNTDKMLAFLTDKAGFIVTRFADCPPSLYPVIEDYLTNYKEEMQ